jgi:hypothetical protein
LVQQANRVSRVSWCNRDSDPKLGNSSQVTENSANTESQVTENSDNTESRVTENLVNEESWVIQNTGSGKTWRARAWNYGKRYSEPKASSIVVPEVYYQDAKE